jgi:hypothetical protein
MQDGKEADDKNPIKLPGKFTPRNWVGWWESVKNYLKGQKGEANKPLFYIVRSRNAPMELPDEVTRVAYQMQLAGNHFNSDNQTVYRILKSLTLDTEAYAWVQPSDAANCRKTGHVKKNCLKLKKKESQQASNEHSNRDRQMYDSQDVAFTATSENHSLSNDIWICDSGACGHYCNFKEGLFDVIEICEDITVGNGRTMTVTMVGSLKCNVIQLHGPSLVV